VEERVVLNARCLSPAALPLDIRAFGEGSGMVSAHFHPAKVGLALPCKRCVFRRGVQRAARSSGTGDVLRLQAGHNTPCAPLTLT